MTLLESAKIALDESNNIFEWSLTLYKIIISILIVMPLLFIVGFVCGLLLLKNPYACGVGLIKQTF